MHAGPAQAQPRAGAARRGSARCLGLLAILGVLGGPCRAADCAGFRQPRFMQGLPGGGLPRIWGEALPPGAPPQDLVSVVLMNWKRPDNVQFIVAALENYTAVGEARPSLPPPPQAGAQRPEPCPARRCWC